MKYLLVVALGLMATSAFAMDKSNGCGLGWSVVKKHSLLSSTTRATTNAIASNSIGMTLGTSGCAKHDIVKADKEQIFFSEANFENLIAEMSAGQGEFLDAYAQTFGCSVEGFGKVTQAHYDKIISDDVTPAKMLNNVKTTLRSSELQCAMI